jgi:hypothetical protein
MIETSTADLALQGLEAQALIRARARPQAPITPGLAHSVPQRLARAADLLRNRADRRVLRVVLAPGAGPSYALPGQHPQGVNIGRRSGVKVGLFRTSDTAGESRTRRRERSAHRIMAGQGRTKLLVLSRLAPRGEADFPHRYLLAASPAISPAVSKVILLAKSGEGAAGDEAGEVAAPGSGERCAADPADEANEIDRSGGREMLESRLGGPDIAGAP